MPSSNTSRQTADSQSVDTGWQWLPHLHSWRVSPQLGWLTLPPAISAHTTPCGWQTTNPHGAAVSTGGLSHINSCELWTLLCRTANLLNLAQRLCQSRHQPRSMVLFTGIGMGPDYKNCTANGTYKKTPLCAFQSGYFWIVMTCQASRRWVLKQTARTASLTAVCCVTGNNRIVAIESPPTFDSCRPGADSKYSERLATSNCCRPGADNESLATSNGCWPGADSEFELFHWLG